MNENSFVEFYQNLMFLKYCLDLKHFLSNCYFFIEFWMVFLILKINDFHPFQRDVVPFHQDLSASKEYYYLA